MPSIVPRLLKETTGETLFDKFVLNFLKGIYLIMRLALRIALGKKRRDRLYINRQIGFNSFLNRSMRFLHLHNLVLLRIYVPKYNYRFFCRSNNEDYTFMTGHEDDLIKFFIPEEGDTVVDIGAHIGHYTILSSMRVGPNGKVIAVEAHGGNFDMLNRNVKLNHLNNVVTLNYAVYSEETKIKLYLPAQDSDFTIYNTVMTDRGGKDGEKFVEVDANTLDNLLQQNGIKAEGVNWVKIDVEGAELEVLKGATNVLSRSKNIALLIEVHNIADGANLYSSIMDLLGHYNFKIEFERTYPSGEKHVILRKQ